MTSRGASMKFRKAFSFLILAVAGLVLAGAVSFGGEDPDACAACGRTVPENCTVIMVGKAASTDGSVMTTHTCDCGECDWTWRWVPAADHPAGATRKIYHVDQFGTWPPDQGLKWECRPGEPPDRPGDPRGPAHPRLRPRGLRLHERQAGGHRRIDHRLSEEDGEPHARGQVRHHDADPHRHGAGGTAREAIRVMGELGEKHGYGNDRHRRDAGRGRPERGLAVRDHAGRPAVDARRAGSPGPSGAPSASPTTRSPSARTNRGSARSTSRSPTSSWPRPTSSRWP